MTPRLVPIAGDRDRSTAPSDAGRRHPAAWLTRAWARGPAVAGLQAQGPLAHALGPTRRAVLGAALVLSAALLPMPSLAAADPALRQQALDTMRKATRFMTEKVAYQGGYVWSYLPDMSRRWGEIEATPTMVWIQPPGTATVGHVFLDAYNATGDESYYKAAEQVAGALIKGQHPAGGWNYVVDFAGEEALKKWYATVGANAWRLEEFQHYYGNATFDDAGTAESSQFLLRMYVAKKDPKYRPALDKTIRFVLDSQYPNGGWPQRFPFAEQASLHGKPDYTRYITFNDDVAAENIKFLIMVYQALGDRTVLDAVRRGMDIFTVTQQKAPQAGWALQYTPDLQPAGARSYEPKALVTHTTAANIGQLMDFYQLTGDPKYLAPIPAALDWLERVKLPADQVKNNRTHPTFIEIGTDRPLYVHRRGSNVVNGEYYVDYDLKNTITHYSSTRAVDLAGLRKRYEALKATPPAEAARNSPLKAEGIVGLPRYFSLRPIEVSDLNSDAASAAEKQSDAAKVKEVVGALNAEGWWPSELRAVSNPYVGPGNKTPEPGDFSQTRVGDRTDTSPYITDTPAIGISTGLFVQNMATLLGYVAKE